MAESKELQVRDKQEVAGTAEQTKPGLVFTPSVDIYETEKAIVVLADMPGVKSNDLNIDLKENTLKLTGEIIPVEGPDEQDLLIEYEVGKYFRQFTLSEVINQEKIEAELKDGVLKVTLPKVEKATPRKISVKTE